MDQRGLLLDPVTLIHRASLLCLCSGRVVTEAVRVCVCDRCAGAEVASFGFHRAPHAGAPRRPAFVLLESNHSHSM